MLCLLRFFLFLLQYNICLHERALNVNAKSTNTANVNSFPFTILKMLITIDDVRSIGMILLIPIRKGIRNTWEIGRVCYIAL